MSRLFKTLCLVLIVGVAVASAAEKRYDFRVAWKWLNPDGYWRNIFTINDQFPGPVINVTEGDTVIIKVTNTVHRDSISLHCHGLSMRGFPEMDGAAGFTQLPIPPLQSYEYKFVVSEPGTHWYHAHMALQYCDGLYGPLIVQKKTEPLRALYDEEIPIILSDYFHVDGNSLGTARPDPHHWLPYPLINGRGQFNCSSIHEHPDRCTPIEMTEFVVKPGLRYRLRLIGAMSRVGFKFSVSGHTLKVIGRQGLDVEPFETNEVSLFLGDRYDVILDANQPVGEYLVRVQITGCDACTPDGKNNQPNFGYSSYAAVRYQGAAKGSAIDHSLALVSSSGSRLVPTVYRDHRIKPVGEIKVPTATKTWVLNMTSTRYWRDGDVAPHREWFFNGKIFHGMMTSTPLLYRVMRGESFDAEKDLIFTAQYGDVIDFIFNAQHNQDHPMHLHGYKFFVLGAGKGSYDGDKLKLNLVNPALLDTMNVEGDSWLYLRFVADNPGAWIMHCHLDFHHREEMAFGFVVAPEKLRETAKMAQLDMCDTYSALVQQYGIRSVAAPHSAPEAEIETHAVTRFVAICAVFLAVGTGLLVFRFTRSSGQEESVTQT